MAPSGGIGYRVEVLHFLNPHLIWVEVVDAAPDEYVFEQIGLYGMIPMETTMSLEEDLFVTQHCLKWVPASSVCMKRYLADGEVWFKPVLTDRRSTIFNVNEHKFGNILIKKPNTKPRKLSKLLTSSGFANYDPSLFHQYLSAGRITTRLNSASTEAVIKQIEKYYLKKKAPKNKWEMSIRNQTSVFQASKEMEMSLTKANLQKHNEAELIKNKKNDFELCKGVDEESVGRASKASSMCNDEERLRMLEQHFDRMKAVKLSSKKGAFKVSKMYVESSSLGTQGKTFMEVSPKTSKKQNEYDTCKSLLELGENLLAEVDEFGKRVSEKHAVAHATEEESAAANTKSKKRKKKAKFEDEAKVVFAPPGINISKVHPTVLSSQDEIKTTEPNEEVYETAGLLDDFSNEEVQSIVDISKKVYEIINHTRPETPLQQTQHNEIPKSNTQTQQTQTKQTQTPQQNKIPKPNTQTQQPQQTQQNIPKIDVINKRIVICKKGKPRDFIQVEASSSTATFIQRRSKLVKDPVKKKKVKKPCPGTTNKNLPTESPPKNFPKNTDPSDDDNVSERATESRMENFDPKNKLDKQVKNNVNPFQNIDPCMSVFVDKLLTPVLMLHSKMDKRFQPEFDLSNINFNKHIHEALRSMDIERPMMMQSVTWLPVLRGHSVFMVSPLGSGKTMGYLPAVCRLVADFKTDSASDDINSTGPICIIVCATSRSVSSVEYNARRFLRSTEMILSCYAGVDELDVLTHLLNGCDLLITTAPALQRYLLMENTSLDLRRLRTFVLDDCERLSSVYMNEVKLALNKINEMLRNRVHKELKVQYIVASRIWCDFMKPLALKAPDSVICIGAFQECVLYSKTNMTVKYAVDKDEKLKYLNNFLEDLVPSKRTVIVCGSDEDVVFLNNYLRSSTYFIFPCDSGMTVQDLYNLSSLWSVFKEQSMAPILLCCDSNLAHMNVTNAHYLIHYSMPYFYSTFCKRFSVLNDYYASIFKDNNETVRIQILLDESNTEQLPKIVNFIRRCKQRLPEYLNKACEKILAQKDLNKAKCMVPLCESLLSLGGCPDFYNCPERHTSLKQYDQPKNWIPKSGIVTFRVIHYISAAFYSARLIAHIDQGVTTKYPQTLASMSINIGLYYCKEKNRIPLGTPKAGDICVVSASNSLYKRCQVLKVLSTYKNGKPNWVSIWLLDEGFTTRVRDIYLYNIPKELKEIETHVVHVRLANIKPRDNDVVFSDLARDEVRNMIGKDRNMFMRGNIVQTLGNCMFIDTLEVCQDLTSVNETVVKYNVKRDLLRRHAEPNPDHMIQIKKLYDNLYIQEVVKNKTRWACLERKRVSPVFFVNALDPETIFIRQTKFESSLKELLQEIENFVGDNDATRILEIREGDIVLARNPNESIYQRARVDEIQNEAVKCFFVDLGDWMTVTRNNLLPIVETFVTKLPFQAIECRLIGVKPPGEKWTEFCTNYLVDQFLEDREGIKQLYAKYFTEEPAEFTDGYKYGVVLVDSHGKNRTDIVINQAMIDVNLARGIEGEIKLFDEVKVSHAKSNKDEINDEECNESVGEVEGNSGELNDTLEEDEVNVDESNEFSDEGEDDHDESNEYLDEVEANDESNEYLDEINHNEVNGPIDENLTGEFDDDESIEVNVNHDESNEILDNGEANHYQSYEYLDEGEGNHDDSNEYLDEVQINHNQVNEPLDGNEANNDESNEYLEEVEIKHNEVNGPFDENLTGLNDDESIEVNVNHDESNKFLDEVAVNHNESNVVEINYDEFNGFLDEEFCDPPINDKEFNDSADSHNNTGYFTTMLKNNSHRVSESSINKGNDQNPDQQLNSTNFLSPATPQCTGNPSNVSANGINSHLRKPIVRWKQTRTTLTIKIDLIDVEDYELIIKDKNMKFSTVVNSTNYGFDFELCGVVDSKTATHSNRHRYILVKLNKIMARNWLTLTKDGEIRKWIKYDFDAVSEDDSASDVDNSEDVNAIKKMIGFDEENSNSEAESDGIDLD